MERLTGVDLETLAASLATGISMVTGRPRVGVVAACGVLGASVSAHPGTDGHDRLQVIGNGGTAPSVAVLRCGPSTTEAAIVACVAACAGLPFDVTLEHYDTPDERFSKDLEKLLFRQGANIEYRGDGTTRLRPDAHPEMMPRLHMTDDAAGYAGIFLIASALRGKDITVSCATGGGTAGTLGMAADAMSKYGRYVRTTESNGLVLHEVRSGPYTPPARTAAG